MPGGVLVDANALDNTHAAGTHRIQIDSADGALVVVEGSGARRPLELLAGAVDNTVLADMAAWTIKLRNNAGSGDPEDVLISALTEKVAPVAGDWILGMASTGELRKYDVGNMPAGSEVNALVADGISGIADDQLAVGTGAGTAAYQTLPNGAVAYSTAGGTFSQASSSDLSDGPFLTAEDNDLATDGILGIIDDQLAVGTGAGTAAYKTLVTGALSYNTTTNNFAQANFADLNTKTHTHVDAANGGTLGTSAIDDEAITLAKLAHIATASFLGRVTAATGDVEVLTGTQATTLLDVFTSGLKGLVPASGGLSTEYLSADGTFSVPAGGSNHNILSATHSDTTGAASEARGDLLVRNATSQWTSLPVGGANTLLHGGTDPSYSAVVTADITANNITNALLAQMAANTIKVNATAVPADPADLAVGTNTVVGRVAGNIVAAQLATAQIADGAVDNTKLADMAGWTIQMRNNAASGDPQAVAISALTEELTPSSGMDGILMLATGELRRFDFANLPAGSETNNLAVDGVAGIADNQLAVGTGASTAGYQTLPTSQALAFNGTGFVQASASQLTDGIPNTRTVEVAGTANEIVSSAAAQDLSANRTWTIGIADAPTIPGDYMTVPLKADPDPTGSNGRLFYNTTDNKLRYAVSTAWKDIVNLQDAQTFTGNNVFSGTSNFSNTISSTSVVNFNGASQMRVPGNVTLSAENEITIDSTDNQLKYRVGTADHVLMPFRICGIPAISPTTGTEAIMMMTDYAITIDRVRTSGRGGGTVAYEIRQDTDADNAGTLIEGNTDTADGTIDTHDTITAGSVPADRVVWIEWDTVTGTVDDWTLQFRYTVDAT